MRIAVLTLTRDRVDYTQHCFAQLAEYAGCAYDHYILDQGSTDETLAWLAVYRGLTHAATTFVSLPENIGISRGMNLLLDMIGVGRYDVIVKLDNDCELFEPNTLRDVCSLALEGDALLSPRILGLSNPPAARGTFEITCETIIDIPQIGGIFLAAPATVYQEFRFDANAPLWGEDDVSLCCWFRSRGGRCGYVDRLEAWHYETTGGPHDRYPGYFARTLAEGKAVL